MLVLQNGRMEAKGGDDSDYAVGNGSATSNDEQARHARFVAALDGLPDEGRLGQSSSIAMDQLAATLGWTQSETEEHAYRYFAALTEISEEEYGTERLRERRQTDYLKRSNTDHTPGSWTPEENRLLQTLLASLSAPEGQKSINLCARIMRFFPERTRQDVERQVEYLRQRRRVAESMES